MAEFEPVPRRGFYRSRKGIVFGVCAGIARYFDFSTFWIRTITVCILIFSGIWPVLIIYFGLALAMKPEPVIPMRCEGENEFYDSYLRARGSAVHRLRRRYDDIDRRIRRIENVVTSRDFHWHRRLDH